MPKTKMPLPEILSPAGNFEKLPFALRFGADAVYLAGREFGMRSAAGNFSDDELVKAVKMCHGAGKKAYLTVNVMPHQKDMKRLEGYLERVAAIGPDALIVSDLGVFSLCKRILPGTDVHVSTQASTVNAEGCRAWFEMGARRVVLARELTLKDIKAIRDLVPPELELEVFVHGSMCVSYSGRCLLSNYFTGRDANNGACTQPCRWGYHFAEDSRENDLLTLESHPEGSFIFGSKDLCMIDHLKELRDIGITSFKIEGRMKSAYYCAAVTNAYRIALDEIDCPKTPSSALWHELMSVPHRAYCTGFYFDPAERDALLVTENGYMAENGFLTVVEREVSDRIYLCRQKNKFSAGEELEVLSPGSTGRPVAVLSMMDEEGRVIPDCPHPKMPFLIQTNEKLLPGDILRRKILYN